MKKNYNNYLSSRLFNGLMKLSLLIVMLLLVTTSTFAQLSKTVKVSNNAELTQAINNTDVTVITLSPGDYELLKLQVLPEEEVKIFLEEGNRSPNVECIYYIATTAVCHPDHIEIQAGMLAGGTNCAVVNSGVWTYTGPGTVNYTQATNIQIQDVTVTTAGSYSFTYTWPNLRVVNGNYVWNDTPTIVFPTPAEVCGLLTTINASYTVTVASATQSESWAYSGPGTATVTESTGTQWDVVVSQCGTYSFTYTASNGSCVASQDAQISFYDTPVVDAGSPADQCGLQYELNPIITASCDHPSQTAEWTYTGPGTASFTGNIVDVTVCGEYVFTYTVDNGPCAPVADNVVINFYDTPVVDAGLPADQCGLEYTLLPSFTAACDHPSQTTGWTYAGPGTATFTGNLVDVTVCGSYTFTYTVDNGPCAPVSDSVVISFFDTPVVDAGSPAEQCGLQYELIPSFTASCDHPSQTTGWTYAGPGTATFTGNLVDVTICGAYTFTYTVDNGPCDPVSDNVVIDFFDTPVVSIASVPDVCGLSTSLGTPTVTVGCDPGDMVTLWTKTGGPGTATFTGNSVVVSLCGSYTFTYSVTNAPCPLVSSTVNVKFYDTPVLTVHTPQTPTQVCGYETDYWVSYNASCELGTVTQTVTQTAGPGTSTITLCDGPIMAPCTSSITVSQCGLYTFTYTVDNGPCTETIDFPISFYEIPTFDIVGTVSPTLCAENTFAVDDLRACEFGTVTYTWVITGGYIDDGGAVTVTTTVGATETLTVVWDQNVTGNMTVVGATIEGCTWTDTFTVYPQMPTLAGQVKYWNNVETYMPTPFGTIENASYPHDYFYVTLYNGATALETVLVEPYLTEDLDELMSYFQFDLGDWFPTYGCTGYSYKVWDGGLSYYALNGDYGAPQGLLGANYTYRHWGGVNATDALAIQLMATNININGAPYNFSWVGLNTDTPRYGYYSSSVANVNSSSQTNPITALDALTTNYRAVGLLPVFPDTRYGAAHYSPNFRVTGRMVPSLPYTTWSTPFDLDNVDDVPFTKSVNNYLYYNLATDHMYSSGALSLKKYDFINIYYLALGDVNSSYIPTDNGFKAASAMELEYTDEMTVAKGDIVTVPIRIDRNAQIGAISLNLTYNTGLIEVLGVNYEKDYYSVDAENGTIRIGWFDVVPADFGFGDAIALVKVRVLADITADTHFFELEEGTDLADASAQSLKDIKLQTSAIVTSDEGLFVTNYPNPFNGQTMISYFLPSDSKVVLVVYNTMSQVVETLVNANQNAGTHQVQFGSPALKPGVYYYKLVVESEGNTVVKTNSMIRMQ